LIISAREYLKYWNIGPKGIHMKGMVVELVDRPRKFGEMARSSALGEG
jgi:hypothetical protein